MEEMGVQLSASEFESVMRKFDTNRDGEIDYQEFNAVHTMCYNSRCMLDYGYDI